MAKTYKCPYCEKKLIRPLLIKHIDKVHCDLIPENYTSIRLVYDIVNNITDGHGKCRVCHGPTRWNEYRYNVLCDNPKCKQTMREAYKKNMLRVRGTYNILNDPEQQKVMLSHRKISGVYNHSDGGKIQYTGEYERKFLEFIDNMLQISSSDIISPGPTIEYEYKGQKHIYIPDFYYIPFNLIIEIKDGGENINKKNSPSMQASREKTIEKERVITDKGIYNYLRLTNNAFEQLIDIFMTIKEKIMAGENAATIKINESEEIVTANIFFSESTKEIEEDTVISQLTPLLNHLNSVKINKNFTEAMIDNMLDQIQPLRDFLNGITYKFGKSDNLSYYKLLSPKGFEKKKYGVCLDFVNYEDYWLTNNTKYKRGKDYKCFNVTIRDEENEPQHVFILIYANNKVYWFESAWGKYSGIHKFNNEKEAITFIANAMRKQYNNYKDKITYSSYNPTIDVPNGSGVAKIWKIFKDKDITTLQ